MNHWVSRTGPYDRCAACGAEVPNASESGPCIITGECAALRYVPRDWLFVCAGCLAKPPHFGVEDLAWPIGSPEARHMLHPGWCMICRAWMGDDFHVVSRRPPVVDLVSAIFGAAGLV